MARQALGKGLEALIPSAMRDLSASEKGPRDGGATELSIASIKPNPYQPRIEFDALKLAELADSIREQGILQPILVVKAGDGHYTLVSGERRLRAAQSLGLTTIPALLRESLTPEQMAEMALIENVQRDDLNAMEEARAYRRIVDELKLTQEEVAKKVGKDRTTVANSLRLLRLPLEVQSMVEKELLSMGHVRALLSIDRPEAQKALAHAAEREGWSVRQMERAVAEKVPASSKKSARKVAVGSGLPVELAAMQDRLRRSVGTKVAIRPRGAKGGTIEIEYYSDEELERLMDLLSSSK
ncbi:MAG: ParB/RepB/Spo0J family partition protein [candidate division FCPU426 bacterium]